MKKILLSLFVVFSIAACSQHPNDSHDHGDGTHSHAEEEKHQHADTLKSAQEEFTIDSTKNDHGHKHHEGNDHKH